MGHPRRHGADVCGLGVQGASLHCTLTAPPLPAPARAHPAIQVGQAFACHAWT